MKRKGFTLVEVLIVVIIIGILAAIGIPQFGNAIERARGSEARLGLGLIRTAEGVYYAENETYTAVIADLDLADDISETYWTFTVETAGLPLGINWRATATRSGAGPWAGQLIRLSSDGTYDGGADPWQFL